MTTVPRPRWLALRLPVALLLAALLLAIAAGPAAADHRQVTVFDPPGNQLANATNAVRNNMLDQIQALGAGSVRLLVYWRSYAPAPFSPDKPTGFDASDPTDYPPGTFDALDASVKGITQRGMRVLMTPTAPAPRWATAGGSKGLNRPDPAALRDFTTALGRRYSGDCSCGTRAALPRVDFWSVWNEPNLFIFLHPQFAHGRSVSGAIYRRLYLAAQQGLQATGHGNDPLLIGETAPTPGTRSTAPLAFLRDVLCLDGRYQRIGHCAPIRSAGWAQHPYLLGVAPWAVPAQTSQISVGSIDRLEMALQRASRAGATTTKLPVWVTEFGIESYPEPATRFGVPPLRQAEWLGICEYLLWRDPWVRGYGQYLLTDDPGASDYLSFQTGLRYANGVAKPSYSSFPMTLVARRIGSGTVVLWGHVRPGAGIRQVDLSYRDAAEQVPQPLSIVNTDNNGYFTTVVSDLPGREFRATTTLGDGRILQGPFIHSYTFPVD